MRKKLLTAIAVVALALFGLALTPSVSAEGEPCGFYFCDPDWVYHCGPNDPPSTGPSSVCGGP